MTKNLKNNNIVKIAILLSCIALCIMIIMVIPQNNVAFAMDHSEELFVYRVNGEATDVVVLERGDAITVVVEYNGNEYEPILIPSSEEYSLTIMGNVIGLDENSIVGGMLEIAAKIETLEGKVISAQNVLTVYPVMDKVDINHVMAEDGYEINGDFVSINARIKMDDQSVDVVLHPGDGIDEIMNSVGKDSFGNIEVETLAVTMKGVNGLGNEQVYTLKNNSNNLSIEPYATNTAFSGGSGTSSDPYLISTTSDFQNIYNYDSESKTTYFKQCADISLETSPNLVLKTFNGYYDGDNKNVYQTSDVKRSFGFCRKNVGTIKNVNITYETGTEFSYLSNSGIVGYNYGNISNCKVEGFLLQFNIGALFGGIAAFNMEGGKIEDCEVNLSTWHHVVANIGGIVGINYANVIDVKVSLSILLDDVKEHTIGAFAASNDTNGIFSGVHNELKSFKIYFGDCTDPSVAPRIGSAFGVNTANPVNYLFLAFCVVQSSDYKDFIKTDQQFNKQYVNSFSDLIGKNDYVAEE